MRSKAQLIIGILLIGVLAAACNLSSRGPGEDQLPTYADFFPTPGPTATPPPTATFTPYPTPTPRDWPSPYFGTPGPPMMTPVPSPAPVLHNPDDFTVLLLGSDRRDVTFATDVILVVNYQPQYNAVSLLSIPRTTVVYIPGWKMEKVNKAYQHGQDSYYPGLGPALVADTLLYNFGIEIDRYMLVDFGQFETIIDTLGGLEIPVACPYTDYRLISPDLDPKEEDNWGLYTIPAGLIQMDGEQALWYARSRLKSSDFDRNRRQQEIIRALYSQALALEWIRQVPALYTQLADSVSTDFTLYDALTLSPDLINVQSAQIRSYYLDSSTLTRWINPYGQVMHVPNLPAVQSLIAEAFGPPPTKDQPRLDLIVQIWNGTNQVQIDRLAAEYLNYGGYHSLIGEADRTDYLQSRLFDFREEGSPETAEELQALFSIHPDNFAAVPDDSLPYDFLLILGEDYDPCFDPSEIDR